MRVVKYDGRTSKWQNVFRPVMRVSYLNWKSVVRQRAYAAHDVWRNRAKTTAQLYHRSQGEFSHAIELLTYGVLSYTRSILA